MQFNATDAGRAHRAPLDGIRVVACGDTIAGGYAVRLLADLGADIVTVEPPIGDDLRHRPPFVDGCATPDESAAGAYFHAGTRSVVVDPGDHTGRQQLVALLATADIVIRTDPALPVDVELAAAERTNPGLIVVDISTFGRTGPLAAAPGATSWPSPRARCCR